MSPNRCTPSLRSIHVASAQGFNPGSGNDENLATAPQKVTRSIDATASEHFGSKPLLNERRAHPFSDDDAKRVLPMHQYDDSPREHDRSLVAQISLGDQSALETLYHRYRGSLFDYCCLLMPERESAEELLQDTLVAVWKSAGGYAGHAEVKAWLLGIARRQAHNAWRRVRLTFADGEVLEMLETPEPGPEEAALDRAGCAEIARAIALLSPLHQEILRLTFVHDLSYVGLAETLGVPIGTVKSRLNHARRDLRAALAGGETPR
jgi:RNA polymerase sigma factor (sigma-70 family)